MSGPNVAAFKPASSPSTVKQAKKFLRHAAQGARLEICGRASLVALEELCTDVTAHGDMPIPVLFCVVKLGRLARGALDLASLGVPETRPELGHALWRRFHFRHHLESQET